jgi:hypothetical protein
VFVDASEQLISATGIRDLCRGRDEVDELQEVEAGDQGHLMMVEDCHCPDILKQTI